MANVFNRGKLQLGEEAFSGLDLRCLLLQTAVPYVFDPTDNFVANVITGGVVEISVSGYARQVLANIAATENDTDNRVEYEADEVQFTALAAGQTIDSAIVFEFVTNDADSPVISYYNLVNTPTNGGNAIVQFDGSDPGDFARILNN